MQFPERDSAESCHPSTSSEAGKAGVSVQKAGVGSSARHSLRTGVLRTDICWIPKEKRKSQLHPQGTCCGNAWTADPAVKGAGPGGELSETLNITRLLITRVTLGKFLQPSVPKRYFSGCLF